MPGDPRGPSVEQRASDRAAERLDAGAWGAGLCEVGQRGGDDGEAREILAGGGGDQTVVHRARQSLGERILRIVQWETAGRMFERRDFLFVEGSLRG